MPILNGSLQTGLAALTRCVHERGQIQGEEGFCHARTVWRSVVRSSESVHRPRIRLASGRNSSWRSRNGVSEATHPSEGNAVLLRRGTKSYATCTDVSVINHAVLMVPHQFRGAAGHRVSGSWQHCICRMDIARRQAATPLVSRCGPTASGTHSCGRHPGVGGNTTLAADLGYSEPTIAALVGHKGHTITSASRRSRRPSTGRITPCTGLSDRIPRRR